MAAGDSLPSDLEHHFVPVDDGGRLHVVERGSGPPLVLLHGLALSSAVWAPQIRLLSSDHRVIVLDQRGHGQSHAGSRGYSIDRLADDLVATLHALEVRHAVLAGHSLGGMVVLHAASRQRRELHSRVSSLLLVATAAGGPFSGFAAHRVAGTLSALAAHRLLRAERRGAGVLPRGDLAAWLVRLSFGARPVAADIELTRSLIDVMPPGALAELVRTVLTFDVRGELGAIDVPTRVLVGSRDVLTPPHRARALAREIPTSTLTVCPDAGHMLMLECAGEVNEALHELSLKAASPS